jgi:hypothetical protein
MAKERISLEELNNLSRKELIERAKKFSKRYYISEGKKFHLKDCNTEEFPDLSEEDKPVAKEMLHLQV